VPIQKWLFSPISVLGEKLNPRNIPQPVLKFPASYTDIPFEQASRPLTR
jgi:hypothetical protein